MNSLTKSFRPQILRYRLESDDNDDIYVYTTHSRATISSLDRNVTVNVITQTTPSDPYNPYICACMLLSLNLLYLC